MRALFKFLKILQRSIFFVALGLPLALAVMIPLFFDGARPNHWLFERKTLSVIFFVLAGLVIVLRVVILCLDRDHADELNDFANEFKFVLVHAETAWSLGIGLAAGFAGLYLLLPRADAHDRFSALFGGYLGILGITMAVHAFYRQYAPITSVEFLLSRLAKDLKDKDQQHRIYVAFPAINLGYYRLRRLHGDDADAIREAPFCEFEKHLRDAAFQSNGNIRLFTYPLESYSDLYEAYAKQQFDRDDAVTDAETIVAKVSAYKAGTMALEVVGAGSRNGKLVAIAPEAFPHHFVIVGDVIYTIVTFHLPIPSRKNGKVEFAPFRPKKTDGRLAELYTYRRHDRGFADAVANRLDELVKEGKAVTHEELTTWVTANKPAIKPSASGESAKEK